ncbi:MAG: FtsX-like permease family protein [Chloroflexota bacterium]|nr:FtsX-like permease family protein [Chloroflexota bacterium]
MLEVAVSRTTAARLGLKVGDRLPIALAPNAPIQIVPEQPVNPEVLVTGIFEPIDAAGDYWMADRRLLAPRIETTIEGDTFYGAALAGAGSFMQLTQQSGLTGYTMTWRYQVDPTRVRVDAAPGLLADLRRATLDLQRASPGSPMFGGTPLGSPRLASGLPQLIGAYAAAQAPAVALLTVLCGGVAAIGAALLLLLGVSMAERRLATIAILRTRGASLAELLLSATAEGALVAALPAAMAALVVAVALPAVTGRFQVIGAAAVAVGTLVCLVAPALATSVRHLADAGARRVAKLDPRRLAAELSVVALAGAGVLLLQRRGLAGSAVGADAMPAADPFLAGVPVMLSLAVGLAVLRLYSIPLRALAALAARSRSAAAVLALRRSSRGSAAAHLPLVVLLLSASVVSFGAVIASTVENGQVQAAWLAVGADYRVSAPAGETFPTNVELAQVPGVEAEARAAVREATFGLGGSNLTDTHLIGLDVRAYERVVVGTPIAATFPSALTAKASASGSDRDPIPSVVASLVSGRDVRVGDRLLLVVDQQTYSSVVVGVRDAFPGVPGSFVLVDRQVLRSALGHAAPELTALYVRAPNVPDGTMRRAARAETSLASVASRSVEYERMHGGPLVAATLLAFVVASALAALYTGLALVAMVLVTAPARDRDLILLRTLGLGRRQGVWLTAIEQLPPAVIAIGIGLPLGVAIAGLVLPGLGLDALMGSLPAGRLVVPWSNLLAIGLAFSAVAVVAVTVAAVSARDAKLAGALRIGER